MARINELAPSARNDNSDSRLQTALDFAARGFKIFPQSREKRPLLQGWPTNATDDPKKIESWFKKHPEANFAFVTGKPSDCIVLDVDVKNGQKGEDSLKRLEEEHGKIDTTLIVRTPSGGSHYYFNYPPDLNGVKNVPQLAGYSGLEIKGDNGCITLPGSIYKNGMKYIVERDSPIAPCPEWLKKLLQRTRPVKHKANTGERPPLYCRHCKWKGFNRSEGKNRSGRHYLCR